MGVSTDGIICYGVAFGEDFEFPWDKSDDGCIESWWRDIKGYKPPFELYDANGEYLNGKPEDSKFNEYYDAQSKFMVDNPIPVELVNYCSAECPMYTLAVPSSVKTNSRGYPNDFNPEDLTVSDEDEDALAEFIDTHIKIDDQDREIAEDGELEASWLLCSYWG